MSQRVLAKHLSHLKKDFESLGKNKDPKCNTVNYLSGRLSLLEKTLTTATSNYEELLDMVEEVEKLERVEECFDSIRETYFNYRSALLDALDQIQLSQQKEVKQVPEAMPATSNSADLQLPNVKLPVFSGSYETWRNFRDMFVSIIHSNSGLSNIKKMHYLKSSVSGEAEKLLSHLSIDNGNYTKAWEILTNRYDHTRFLVNTQLKVFFNQPSMSQERADSIKELLDTSTEIIHNLSNLKVPVQHWDTILLFVLLQKLPNKTQQLWEERLGSKVDSKELPTLAEFKQFLESRFRTLEAVNPQHVRSSFDAPRQLSHRNSFYSQAVNTKFSCKVCNKGQHAIRKCSKFLKLSIGERCQIVDRLGICKNCLAYSHTVEQCPSNRRCYYCQQPHHSLLHTNNAYSSRQANSYATLHSASQTHPDQTDSRSFTENSHNRAQIFHTAAINVDAPNFQPSSEEPVSTRSAINTFYSSPCSDKRNNTTQVLLATALVKLQSSTGQFFPFRALLDSGSEATFITTSAVQLLRLPTRPTSVEISGLGLVSSGSCQKVVDISLASHHSSFETSTQAYVFNSLSGHLPTRSSTIVDCAYLNGLTLADPEFYKSSRIELLLGSDVLADILLPDLVRPNNANLPVAQKTKLGWILFGRAPVASHVVRSFHQTCNLETQLQKFWELEEVPFKFAETPENVVCEEHFLLNIKRRADGRCQVALPFKGNFYPVLGRSREGALQRFKRLEARLSTNTQLYNDYSACLAEYIKLGHMTEVKNDSIVDSAAHYYLPHHAVIKESSATTKLRVVFDASFKTSDGTSLNDRLMTGPALQNNITDIIIRWRLYRYTFTADIEKMYRQIWVGEQDSNYQLILWRSHPSETLKTYRLKTVTFGTAPAPYLAIRTLNWIGEKACLNYPLATKMIREEMYVDDLISGADSKHEAVRKIEEIRTTLDAAGLKLRKWATNSEELLQDIPLQERETSFAVPSVGLEELKTLGIHWLPVPDKFFYSYTATTHPHTTKRSILSTIARLFDPMGWISPCIVKAKCFLQLLWIRKKTWDEPVDLDILNDWNLLFQDLESINDIRLPRWVQVREGSNNIELHGFCDASNKAFGAAIYMRTLDREGKVHMNLLIAKTRVAPVKPVSIPRLELCGAVILARLLHHVTKVLNISDSKVHAWTDSTITLCWIKAPPSRWETFVANRIGEIQRLTNSDVWKHIPTEQNPADLASRGVLPSALKHANLWWNGPSFLHTAWEFEIPHQPTDLTTKEGQRPIRVLRAAVKDNVINQLIRKISNYSRLVRTVAYCVRFINKFRKHYKKFIQFVREQRLDHVERRPDPLTPTEIDTATRILIRLTQQEIFPDGISKSRGMGPLNPFVDNDGILRVGGRLTNANLQYDQQHPIILTPTHTLTELLIREAHVRTLHGNFQQMVVYLRSKFWIFSLKRAVKKCIHHCTICFRYKNKTSHQLMGELPAPRVSVSRPFTHTGVDYAGPISIKAWKGRGAKCYKGYLAIFVCLATKAIHLEAVTDLTTPAFLAAFRRFTGRRGVCSNIYSDCGKNFAGAEVELRRLMKVATHDWKQLADVLASQGTKWNFIPPASPHFGGLWEAGVKSVKYHFKRVVGNGTLTYEELSTLLVQIEACLNSRPLCPLTENPDDFQALTPAHFLIGEAIYTTPEADLTLHKPSYGDRWKILQTHLHSFWSHWQLEYLARLQQRPKWLKPQPQLKEGDLVLLKDERLPPARWNLCRIVETYPGADKKTRVVKIKTSNGEYRRPITKLCSLPINSYQKETDIPL